MLERIVLASSNPGKIKEIQAIFQHCQIIPQSEFNVPDIEETGHTFVENAIIKARNAAHFCNLPAIADDSGIEVDALNGEPGVRSARYAGVGANDQQNLNKLLETMTPVADHRRNARFRCVMVFMKHAADPCPVITEGAWEGKILHEPRGMNGFGYDPVFFVPSEQCTAAELTADRKNSLSHRGQALACLLDKLSKA